MQPGPDPAWVAGSLDSQPEYGVKRGGDVGFYMLCGKRLGERCLQYEHDTMPWLGCTQGLKIQPIQRHF